VYTVAALDTTKGTLTVLEVKVEAKTQEKAMQAVADRSQSQPVIARKGDFHLVAWLANSTRAKRFRQRTMPVTESEDVTVSDELFVSAEAHAAES
jgi:hypothetical protein